MQAVGWSAERTGITARTSAPARLEAADHLRRRGRRTGRSPPRCGATGRALRRRGRRAPSSARGTLAALRRADEDEFAHAERLQAVDLARGLAAEAIGGDVEDQPVRRHRAARGRHRIEGITGRRRQHEVGRARARRSSLPPRRSGRPRAWISAFVAARGAQTQPSRCGKLFR